MKHSSLRLVVGMALVLGTGASLPACSKTVESKGAAAAEATPAAETESAAAMVIEAAPNGVVLDNRVGRRLLNVRIAIDVKEFENPFILVVPTLEKETKTLLEFERFRSEEATILDPTLMHLTQVKVTARDTFAKAHEATVPWTPAP